MAVLRLKSVIKDLNISLSRAVEFLAENGFTVAENPNAKITDEMYNVLVREFQSDKAQKEASSEVVINKIPETRKEEKAKEELAKPDLVEKKEVQEVKREAPKKEVEKPEEKPLPKNEPKEEVKKTPEVEKPKEEKPTEVQSEDEKQEKEKVIETKEVEVKPKNKLNVLGKIDLEATKPKKTKKPEPKQEEKPKAKEEKKPEPKEEKREEEKIEHIETKFKKLEGPNFTGEKVDLKQFEKKKKPSNERTGKRKRITKNVNVREEGNKAYKGRRGGNQRGNNRPKSKPVAELTDEEVQKQVKETLEKLTKKGSKNKGAKHRREKRVNRREEEAQQMAAQAKDKTIEVTEFVTPNELASLMDVSPTDVITACFNLGVMVTMNQRLDAEIITLVTDEFGYEAKFADADLEENIEEIHDNEEDLEPRAPIVTVMGHVDHGKTSLLDYIRETNVIAGESGGITQHIGAYRVKLKNGKSITFLDTPGHEAFTAMRARGAQVTDIAIIVIAADDDIMPQTKEAISHAQAAGVPMIFAINKVDKEAANPEKIKEQLAAMNLLVEDWGGKIQSEDISAKKGTNVEELLEKVLLEAELLDLKANPNRIADGVVIEATLEKGRGYTTTLLVQNGTLKVGDYVLAGKNHGKIRALLDERGHDLKEAGPSMPATVLGLDGAPTAGDKFRVFNEEKEAKNIASKREQIAREHSVRTQKHITLDEIGRRIALGDFQELNIILKGDVDGSVEALTDSLQNLSTEEIHVNILHKGVGQITESDILLASASDAIVIGFNVRPGTSAKQLADKEEIEIRTYSIIYDAINEVKEAMEGMLSPVIKEERVGTVEVRETYKISKVGTIAGCMVTQGKILRNSIIKLVRDGVVIHEGELASLKRFKDDVKEVNKGYECGLNIKNYNDIEVGDIIEAYEEVKVKKKLK